MIIAAIYSHNGGKELMEAKYPVALAEIMDSIAAVDGEAHKTKISQEKTMKDRRLYNPRTLNSAVKQEFVERGWKNKRVKCEYPTQFYTEVYHPQKVAVGAFRDMDFIKNRVGIEVQFGKYGFAIYNVCAKMTIFHNLDLIDVGVEIVPVMDLVTDMSSGVTYFEQFVWDLTQRGVSNIDLPVLILGIASVNNSPTVPPTVVDLPDPENEVNE